MKNQINLTNIALLAIIVFLIFDRCKGSRTEIDLTPTITRDTTVNIDTTVIFYKPEPQPIPKPQIVYIDTSKGTPIIYNTREEIPIGDLAVAVEKILKGKTYIDSIDTPDLKLRYETTTIGELVGQKFDWDIKRIAETREITTTIDRPIPIDVPRAGLYFIAETGIIPDPDSLAGSTFGNASLGLQRS